MANFYCADWTKTEMAPDAGSLRTVPVTVTPEDLPARFAAKASLKNTAVIAPLGPVMGILHFNSQAFKALMSKR